LVIDIDDPIKPKLVGELTGDFLKNPRAVAVQFRYAFVTDEEGLKVCDLTEPDTPRAVPGGVVKLSNAQRLYTARTYAYVANGSEGLAIIDIEKPEQPRLGQMFNAGGALSDTRAVQVGSISASQFALVADGRNGLRVIQLISPENVPGFNGFSPRPNPKLIATFPTRGPAVAVSRGLDRDRVVDETGHQTVVFGRRGARPFNASEMAAFFRHSEYAPTNQGKLYQVEDVTTRAGELQTREAKVLTPSLPFKSETEPSPVRPSSERLIRRGK
jgi:hypothetical protein